MGRVRANFSTGIKFKNLSDQKEYTVAGLPSPLQLSNFSFSPDSHKAIFLQTYADHVELWLIDLATFTAKRLTDKKINATLANPITWLSNSQHILVLAAEPTKALPQKVRTPAGPVIEENLGKKAPSRTYQDLLKNPYDEALFEYYGVNTLFGNDRRSGKSDRITRSIRIDISLT